MIFANTENLGPIAIIGIYNPSQQVNCEGFCLPESYGKVCSIAPMRLYKLDSESAKRIRNYTVFGINGLDILCYDKNIKFDVIDKKYDSRYMDVFDNKPYVIDAKCEIEGIYDFDSIIKFASNQNYWDFEPSITVGELDSGENVVILGMFRENLSNALAFRKPHVKNEKMPMIHSIKFLTAEELDKVKEFKLYLYDINVYPYEHFQITNNIYNPRIVKLDENFEDDYDFSKKFGFDERLKYIFENNNNNDDDDDLNPDNKTFSL